MKREIICNITPDETRVAITEEGKLVEVQWDRKSGQNIVGNIYRGVVENVLPGISSAFVNIGYEKNAYLYISDVLGHHKAPIDKLLKKGQPIMVQVAKEAISTKGAKVTMDVSLPGRYLVLTPHQDFIGISKAISSDKERNRLMKAISKYAPKHMPGKGMVIRTEAEGASEAELEREVKYLAKLWENIEKSHKTMSGALLLHEDVDAPLAVARDILDQDTTGYLIDNKKAYNQVVDYITKISPELKDRIKLYTGHTPIFKAFKVEQEIKKIRMPKVDLKNGGSIVIQEAESLCAIDVNTGKFTGSKSQEETVTKTNIEAAKEVAAQLRLRNIGGIVVIDFIDMKKQSNRTKVAEALQKAVRYDRAKIRILPVTRLGLIEMTRERRRESTMALLTEECPQCEGSGRVLSAETLRINVQREIYQMTQGRPGGSVELKVHPDVCELLRNRKRQIERYTHRTVSIEPDRGLHWEDYKIVLQ